MTCFANEKIFWKCSTNDYMKSCFKAIVTVYGEK